MSRLEELIDELGALNDRLRQLEDVDYMTAYYKGYSSSGQTVDEINEAMRDLEMRVSDYEAQIEALSEQNN